MNHIRFSQTAPWNSRLTNPYRTRYTEVGGRYFRVEADRLEAPWFVWEIDADGDLVEGRPSVALCWNLTIARQAIINLLAGMDRDEIYSTAVATSTIGTGTGRSHPDNMARRNAWRTR